MIMKALETQREACKWKAPPTCSKYDFKPNRKFAEIVQRIPYITTEIP